MGTSKGKGILFKSINVCTYTHVLKLLSATVGTLVIDSVDKEALGNSVDDCAHALFRTSKIRMQCIIPA